MITRQMWMMGGAGLVSVAVVAGLVATIRPAPAPVETAPAPAAAAPAPQPVTAPPPIRPGGIDGLNLNEAPAKPAPTPSVVTLGDPNAPKFDVVRVEPSGDAVVAGTGRPGAVVRLRADGVIIAESKIEAGGQFVLLPKALAPGGHLLSLETALGGGAPLASAQSVSVNVPKDGKGEVIVALTEPDKATVLLSDAVKSALAKLPRHRGSSCRMLLRRLCPRRARRRRMRGRASRSARWRWRTRAPFSPRASRRRALSCGSISMMLLSPA